jgi:hypothetical protein
MKLMLATLFLCIVVGALARRFGSREQFALTALAGSMTALYFLFGERFM